LILCFITALNIVIACTWACSIKRLLILSLSQCRKMSWPWNPDQRSLEVIESGTIL